jgi:type IV pilus assembly protein PilA
MIVVAIIGILAAVAVPAFLNYITKAKTAEAPSLLKTLSESEAAFFSRPRINSADGLQLNNCYLGAGYAPAQAPTGQKITWAGNPNLNAIGFAAGSQVYYNYSVTGSAGIAVTNGTPAAPTATAGICASNTDSQAAPNTTDTIVYATATGDFKSGTPFSKLYRYLTVSSANVNMPEARGLVIVNELD